MAQTYETRRRSGKHEGSDVKVQGRSQALREKHMKTGKALGFKKGDFVHTGAFPGIIISDVQTFAPCCEVWGFEHEMGSAYAEDLTPLTWEDFQQVAKRYGFDGTADSKVAQEAIAQAKAATGVPVTA